MFFNFRGTYSFSLNFVGIQRFSLHFQSRMTKFPCLTGECWSSQSGHLTYDVNGPSTSKCIDQCAEPCKLHSKFCSGKKSANYVYKIGKKYLIYRILH